MGAQVAQDLMMELKSFKADLFVQKLHRQNKTDTVIRFSNP